MKSEWKEERSSELPEQFKQIADDAWLQRKEIEQEEDENGNIVYRCRSRKISRDVYEALIEEMTSPATESVMQSLTELEAEQVMQGVSSDVNTEMIMQELADIRAEIEALKA